MDQKEMDDILTEREYLRAENERLEELCYRLRTSEQSARRSSLTPAEQVTLHQWMVIDKLNSESVYRWRKQEDFPGPIAHITDKWPLYDLDALRIWRRADVKRREDHRAAKLEERLERGRWVRENWPNECS